VTKGRGIAGVSKRGGTHAGGEQRGVHEFEQGYPQLFHLEDTSLEGDEARLKHPQCPKQTTCSTC
jgi:hypothetical protein